MITRNNASRKVAMSWLQSLKKSENCTNFQFSEPYKIFLCEKKYTLALIICIFTVKQFNINLLKWSFLYN